MLISNIVDQAALRRADNPALLKRGLAADQVISLFRSLYLELVSDAPNYVTQIDRWAVPEYVRELDLRVVNTNLLASNAVTFLGLTRPYDFPSTYVPLNAYSLGQISIALPSLLPAQTYTFTADVGSPISGRALPAGYLILDQGQWNVNYLGPAPFTNFASVDHLIVGLRYPATTNLHILNHTKGEMKLRISFSTPAVAPTHLEIQMRNGVVLGGFKLELGHVGTPSRVKAIQDLPSISTFQMDQIQIASPDLKQVETRLYGSIPSEFQVIHNSRAIVYAMTTELGPIDIEMELALVHGLASALDMANNEGVTTPQQASRVKLAEKWKNRVQNRRLYRQGSIIRGFDVWQA